VKTTGQGRAHDVRPILGSESSKFYLDSIAKKKYNIARISL